MSNRAYDTIKLIALIAAPVTVFAASLCAAWNIPYAEPICATLAAIDVLLGSLVEIFRRQYEKMNKYEKAEK